MQKRNDVVDYIDLDSPEYDDNSPIYISSDSDSDSDATVSDDEPLRRNPIDSDSKDRHNVNLNKNSEEEPHEDDSARTNEFTNASKDLRVNVYDPTKESDYKPVNIHVDPAFPYFTIGNINDELLEPGRFLIKAIEHMAAFGKYSKINYWPDHWLDGRDESERRYVHPQILRERQPTPMEPLRDVPPCTWTEHARVLLMRDHEDDIAYNIEEFLEKGMSDDCVKLATQMRAMLKAECNHLPLLWSVINMRTPNMLTQSLVTYMDNSDNFFHNLPFMVALIQSRYMINVATYNRENQKIKTIYEAIFLNEMTLTFPLVVIDYTNGDIFFFFTPQDTMYSLYEHRSRRGNEILKAIKRACPWLSEDENATKPIHGLVSLEVEDILANYPMEVRLPLALELVCHAITELDFASDIDVQLSTKLQNVFRKCSLIRNLKEMYKARIWWTITRGELGVQSEAMYKFNAMRCLAEQKRSAWDYKQRYALSEKFTMNDWVSPDDVLTMLDDFNDTDIITFSNNTTIMKRNLMNDIMFPQETLGQSIRITDARIDALNRKYSGNGGPRLYSQMELDYMMTNIKGTAQRKKLTSRLYWGKSVYFLMSHEVTMASIQKYKTSSHASLCKVRYFRDSRQLVVHWLEGVFANVYKLCAVPMLTYLSLYFNAEVRQINYAMDKTLCVDAPHCATIALYAAEERMRKEVSSPDTSEWEGLQWQASDAYNYRTRLILLALLVTLK
jgi:hypothetical protein